MPPPPPPPLMSFISQSWEQKEISDPFPQRIERRRERELTLQGGYRIIQHLFVDPPAATQTTR
jgi:hypothetical protein